MTDPITHYVIVRKDLPHGHQLAQSVHAAGESGPATSGTYAVVLAAPDEQALLDLHERLAYSNVPHVLIREPDAPYLGAAMAIGIPPQPRRPLRKYTKGLKPC